MDKEKKYIRKPVPLNAKQVTSKNIKELQKQFSVKLKLNSWIVELENGRHQLYTNSDFKNQFKELK